MNPKIQALCRKRDLLVIFRGLAQNECFRRLMVLLGSDSEDQPNFMADYSDFVCELYSSGTADLAEYILKITLEDENIYVKDSARGRTSPVPV